MAAIAKAVRFFQPGVISFVYIPTIAIPGAPTLAEINGGTRLEGEVDSMTGWTSSTEFIATKDAATRVTTKIAGRQTLEDSSLTFNASKTGTDAGSVFTEGAAGNMLIADRGLVAANKADIYPTEVGAVIKVRDIESGNFKIRVDFGVTGTPTQNYTLPTGTYT